MKKGNLRLHSNKLEALVVGNSWELGRQIVLERDVWPLKEKASSLVVILPFEVHVA